MTLKYILIHILQKPVNLLLSYNLIYLQLAFARSYTRVKVCYRGDFSMWHNFLFITIEIKHYKLSGTTHNALEKNIFEFG